MPFGFERGNLLGILCVMKKNELPKKVQGHEYIKNPSRIRYIILYFLLDIGFAALAYFIAHTAMFFSDNVAIPESYQAYAAIIGLVCVIVVIAMLLFFDCYNTVWKYAGRVEFFKFILAYIAAFVIIVLLKLVLNLAYNIEIWMTLVLNFLLLSALFSGSMRFLHGIIYFVKHVKNRMTDRSELASGLKKTVVIGAGYTGTLVISRFINNPHEGYFPVALIDDNPAKQGMKIYGIMVEGGMDSLTEIMERNEAEAIVIAIISLNKSQLRQIYEKCKCFNVPIKIMPPMLNAGDLSEQTLTLRDVKIEELLGREEFKVHHDLIDSSVRGKTVMITGGAGSIGSELCRQALNFNCKHLIIFDVHENGMFELDQELSATYDKSMYSLVIGTVREVPKLAYAFEKYKPDIVFHAAAYKHVPMMEISATEAIKNNVFGTLNVIEQAEAAGVGKFVLISTDKAVNPANVMGASKRLAEMLIQTRGKTMKMQMAAVRFGNVLGSNGSVIPTFLRQIHDGGPVTLTHRNIKRYFMTIPEAVRLVMQAGAMASGGEVFVLDMGEPIFIYDLACDLIRINGLVPEKDIEIKVTGLREGEKLFEELSYSKESVDATSHEGIFVNKLGNINKTAFDAALAELKEYAFAENPVETERKIFDIVPKESRVKAIKDREESLLQISNADAELENTTDTAFSTVEP